MGSFVENGSKMTFNLFAEILTSGPILFGFAEIVAAVPFSLPADWAGYDTGGLLV